MKSLQSFFIRFWPVLFILGVWFIFASPYFFKGRVPYSSTYQVNHFPPWSSYRQFWGPVKNGAMPDITDQIIPWRHLTVTSLKQGVIPLWNPYNFSGNPHLANFQSAVLSPFNVLFFFLPFVDAWSLLILLQPLCAGLFTYLFLRSIALSKTASALGGVVFMFSGFMAVWMAYGTLSMAVAFLPLALFAVEKSFGTKSFFPLMLLAFAVPFSLFSGHFQTSLYVILFTFTFILFKSLTTRNWKRAGEALLFFVVGILLSFPQLLPSIELYGHSVRSGIYIKDGGIPWQYLVTAFSPDFFGNPVTRNDWFGYYAEWSSFVGIIPLLLALYGFGKKNTRAFFCVLAIVTLLLAVDSPLLSVVGASRIPVLSTSTPSRIIVLFSFSIAVLAAFGFDTFLSLIAEKKKKRFFVPVFVYGLLIVVVWLVLIGFHVLPPDKAALAKRNFFLPTALFGLFLLASVMTFFKKKHSVFPILLSILLLFLTSFDSLRFATKWMPFDPRNFFYPDTPIVLAIDKNIGHDRIYGNLGGQVETYYGFPSVNGYDPLYIGSYGEFIRTSGTGEYLEGERSVVKLPGVGGVYTDRVIDVLANRLIFHPVADTKQTWAYPVWNDPKRFATLFTDSTFSLFENKSALSHASIFYSFEVQKDGKRLLTRFYEKDFPFRTTVLLEKDPKIAQKDTVTPAKPATIVTYNTNKVVAKTETQAPGLLFLSDNNYPGWKAFVDGRETEILRANYSFRGVVIPKGRHTVTFLYDPESFKVGVEVALFSLLGILFYGFFVSHKRSRAR